MASGPRILLDNTTYHIMVRGNQKQNTFLEKEDFLKYIEVLRHYKRKYACKIYGYCLMPNHVHLILEVKKGQDLVKIMQGINQTYTIWFNKKYKKTGHLWQGRYKSMVIQKDKYLLTCIEYIELNPLRANITNSVFNYPWSSWQVRFDYKKDGLLDQPEII
ncbi:MAG: transposase [Candidatus Omnitrophica bacterium]|nr:transposase [Candidatus Omnitrophota bacterium]